MMQFGDSAQEFSGQWVCCTKVLSISYSNNGARSRPVARGHYQLNCGQAVSTLHVLNHHQFF